MAQTVELWARDDFNMVSSWTDYLLATKRRDGSLSIKAKKSSVELPTSHVRTIAGVRSPQQFTEAVLECWEELGILWGYGEVAELVPALERLDINLAREVREYIEGL